MLRVAIIGVTGYAGEELLKILIRHSRVEITSVSAKVERPYQIAEIFPYLAGRLELICKEPVLEEINAHADLVFLALPHRTSMQLAPALIKSGKRVIDLSADYRLKDKAQYAKWYQCQHLNPDYLAMSVYGLPELYRQQIKKAKLLANPGCYPTAAILGLAPLLKKFSASVKEIVIDAKSGYSGAGREKVAEMEEQIKSNFKAYKVNQHQHQPEIEQELSCIAGRKMKTIFVPHLLPLERGILSTMYVSLKKALPDKKLSQAFGEFYRNEPFVKFVSDPDKVELSNVVKTNFCHLGMRYEAKNKFLIVISAIDNLLKGASGQAVQNMNIMYGFKETEGLI
jgi:N-acetyl-gamma-glutamyl-phosphate reductase